MTLRRAARAALITVVTVVVVLHLPPVSSWLVRTAIDRIEGPLGLDIEAGGVSAWPMGLRATLRNVSIRSITDTEPFLSADSLTVDLPLAALRNRSRIGKISLSRPRVDVDGLTRWIDSRPPSKNPNPTVPRIDSLTLADATFSSERFAFTIPGMTLTMTSTLETPLGGAVAASNATLRIGSVVFDPLAIDGELRYDGAVVIERARVTSRDTVLDVAGRIGMREGDRQMALTLGGTVAPLARILAPYLAHPRLDGTLQLDGRVTGTFSAPRLAATLVSDDITVDGDATGQLSTQLVLSRERLEVEAAAWDRVFDGRLAGRAAFEFNQRLDSTIHVDVAGIATAPVLAIVDPTWPSIRARATGPLRINGPLATGYRPDVTADMALARADTSPLASAGRVSVTLDPTSWTTALRDTVIGSVTLNGSIGGRRPADTAAPFATSAFTGAVTASAADPDDALALLHALDIVDMDFSEYTLGGALTASATLSGTLRARVLEAVVDVPALTAHGALSGTLTASATIDPAFIALHDGRAVLGDMTATMRGRVDLVRRRLALDTAVDAPSTDAVVRLFGLSPHLTPTGAFAAAGQLTGSPGRPRIDADVTGSHLVLAGQVPANGAGTIGWDGVTLTCRPCTLTRDASTLTATGAWDTIRGRVDARGAITDWTVDPVAWPPADGGASTIYPVRGVATATFDVEGAFPALSGSAQLTLRDTRWDATQPGTLDATVTLANGKADVTLAAPDLALTGTAVIDQARPHGFVASADLADTELATLVSRLNLDARGTRGRLTGSVSASGRLIDMDSVRAAVSLSAFDGTWRDLPLRLERPSSFDWSRNEITTRNISVSLADVRLDVDGELSSRGDARGVTANVSGRAEQITRILAALDIAAPAMEGSVEGRLAFSDSTQKPSITGQLVIADGVVAWPDRPPVRGIAAQVQIGDGIATLTSLHAQAQDATIEANGRAPLTLLSPFLPATLASRLPAAAITSGSLEATVTNLTHGTAMAYLDEQVPDLWRGGMDATASLTASRLSIDAVGGTVRVTRATLATGDLEVAQTSEGRARLEGGRLVLEPWHFIGNATDLTVSGSANLADASYPYSFALNGILDLRLLGTVLPGRVNGALRSAITVQGSTADLDVLGRLEIDEANWIARDLGLAITGLSGPLVLERDRITVDELTARVNGGALTVTGALSTAGNGAPSEVVFKGSGIAIDIPAGVVSELSGEIRATSPGPRGLKYGLAGDLFVQPGIVRSSLRQLALSAIDATSSPGTTASSLSEVMKRVGLNIRVRTLDDLVADSNELKLSVAGDVTVTGTLAAPGMKGALTATNEGELFFGGKLYNVSSGSIDFVNPNAIEPRLNVVADTRVAGYDVTMQLLGPPTDVATRLTSDPPLSEGDLASLLATGRTLDDRAGVTEEQAKTQLLSAVSSEYLGVVGRWFGLDTVRIGQNSDLSANDINPVARINVSKSFGRKLDVLYSQSLSESGDTAWVITYRTGWNRLDARAIIQSVEGETIEVRQGLTFGGGAKPRPQRQRVETRPRLVDVTFSRLDIDDERDARDQMKLEVGDRFDVFTWRRDQERIGAMFRARDYQRVTVASYRRDVGHPDEIAIDYVVDPGPVTTLQVTGATLSGDAMDEMRAAWSRVGVDEFLVDEWREVVTEDLVGRGYVQPRISVDITTPGNPWIQRDALVVVDPGPQVARREFEFDGNLLIPDDQLEQLVGNARLDPAAWVRPSVLVAPIRERYATLGHLEVGVRVGAVRVEGERAVLPVEITEGRQYLVGTLSINGENAVAEDAISAALGLETGAVYLPGVAQRGADRVAELYHRQAFPDALVSLNTTVDPVTATAEVHVTINEGARHVLAEMAIRGDTITAPSLLKRVTALPIGVPLANRAVEDAQTRMYNTGIFSSVMPTVEPIGEPDVSGAQPVRVVFDVVEQPRYRFRYGVQATTTTLADEGFSTNDVRPGVSADLRRSNLFGRGFFAGVGGSVTTNSNRLRVLAGSATWFGHKADTTFSLERLYESSGDAGFDLTRRSKLASAEQRWPITRRTRIAAGYTFESQEYDFAFIDPISGFPLPVYVKTELGSVSGTYAWDTRDNVFNPSRGLFHSSRVELGDRVLGSDLRYFKVFVQQYGFFVRRGIVLAAAVRFGTVNIAEDADLFSPTVRFQAGGATTVRGYPQDGLTPDLFGGVASGGNGLLILNQEVRLPIWGWLGGVAFVDAGNTFARPRDISFAGLQVGVGGGMRLNTPFGIIRLDLGIPVSEQDALRGRHWYFGFGHAF